MIEGRCVIIRKYRAIVNRGCHKPKHSKISSPQKVRLWKVFRHFSLFTWTILPTLIPADWDPTFSKKRAPMIEGSLLTQTRNDINEAKWHTCDVVLPWRWIHQQHQCGCWLWSSEAQIAQLQENKHFTVASTTSRPPNDGECEVQRQRQVPWIILILFYLFLIVFKDKWFDFI